MLRLKSGILFFCSLFSLFWGFCFLFLAFWVTLSLSLNLYDFFFVIPVSNFYVIWWNTSCYLVLHQTHEAGTFGPLSSYHVFKSMFRPCKSPSPCPGAPGPGGAITGTRSYCPEVSSPSLRKETGLFTRNHYLSEEDGGRLSPGDPEECCFLSTFASHFLGSHQRGWKPIWRQDAFSSKDIWEAV